MLETIAIILLILWALGLVSSYTMGGLIHLFSGHRNRGDRDTRHSRLTRVTAREVLSAAGRSGKSIR
jgi:hypothetical protein